MDNPKTATVSQQRKFAAIIDAYLSSPPSERAHELVDAIRNPNPIITGPNDSIKLYPGSYGTDRDEAAPDMAALLLRCKPYLERAYFVIEGDIEFKKARAREDGKDEESYILEEEKVELAELASILAEMNGEEKKDAENH